MILITGAATRIGAAIARRLSVKNAKIILHYHTSHTAAEKLKTELESGGANVTLWQQDLRAGDLAAQFNKLIAAHGPIETLINNAAVFYPDQDKLGNITPELYDAVMDVNFKAPLVLMQEFATALPDGLHGNIINILDQRVLNISHAFPVYTASKSALWALTQNMARALACRAEAAQQRRGAPNIRVNAIAPGHVLPTAGENEYTFRARQAKTPLGIGPAPEEIAEVIFLILNSPSMTGVCIPLDGGEHLVPKEK